MTGPQRVEVHRAGERFRTDQDGITSWHSFSYGRHYDPDNTSYGPLLALNDSHLEPGAGFAAHPHRDVEILTWVVSGALAHEDSTGSRTALRPGQVHRVSAGTGVRHSERNDALDAPLRVVQSWVQPDRTGVRPGAEQRTVEDQLGGGELVVVASGGDLPRSSGAVRLGCGSAALHVARPRRAQTVPLPTAPRVLVLVTRGAVEIDLGAALPGERWRSGSAWTGPSVLADGDAARLTASGSSRLTALADAEVLVWELHAAS